LTAEEKKSREIETRKVQKLGSSSLFITLPKKWVSKWNIKAGDKVILESSDDGSLRLVAEKARSNINKKYISIDLDFLKQSISTVIPCLYSLGYDEISFETKKEFNKKDIEDAMLISKQLVGAEVSESSDKRIKIECLLDTEKLGVESLLRRILNIISKRIDSLVSVISGNSNNVSDLLANDDLKKIHLMLLRRIIGSKFQSNNEYYRNSFILINIPLLMNVDYIISRLITSATRIDNKEFIEPLKTILNNINDVLDEIIMSILFPSVKRISNGFNLITQIRQTLFEIKDNLPQSFSLYLEDLVNLLENALNNSMCSIFLEDLPWIEKDLTS